MNSPSINDVCSMKITIENLIFFYFLEKGIYSKFISVDILQKITIYLLSLVVS